MGTLGLNSANRPWFYSAAESTEAESEFAVSTMAADRGRERREPWGDGPPLLP